MTLFGLKIRPLSDNELRSLETEWERYTIGVMNRTSALTIPRLIMTLEERDRRIRQLEAELEDAQGRRKWGIFWPLVRRVA